MLYLLNSWKESLLLGPESPRSLLFLTTLKRIKDSYALIIRDFWWVFLLGASTLLLAHIWPQYAKILRYISSSVWTLLVYGYYLIIRPSVKSKKFDYYKDYCGKFFYFLTIIFAVHAFHTAAIWLAIELSQKIADVSHLYSLLFMPVILILPLLAFLIPPPLVLIYLSPLITFAILFMLDSDGNLFSFFRALKNSLKMALYNYPFCMLVLICIVAITHMLRMAIDNHPLLVSIGTIGAYALIPIVLCVYTNFYTLRVHDQFSLYFPKTVKE